MTVAVMVVSLKMTILRTIRVTAGPVCRAYIKPKPPYAVIHAVWGTPTMGAERLKQKALNPAMGDLSRGGVKSLGIRVGPPRSDPIPPRSRDT